MKNLSFTHQGVQNEPELQEFSSKFDYVLVFKMGKDNSQSPYAKDSTYALLEAGLEVYTYLSIQEDELYVMLRCPVRFYFKCCFVDSQV